MTLFFYRCDNPDFQAYISGKGFKISLAGIIMHTLDTNTSIALNLKAQSKKSTKPDFPKFVYVESFTKTYHSKKIRYYDDLATFYTEQDNLPQKIPSKYQDIYEALLDFYSLKELESFRAEYGDQILWQIYCDECGQF